MKKILLLAPVIVTLALVLFRDAIASRMPTQANAMQVISTNTVMQSPTPRPTDTPIPSPTVGYQETAELARQTSIAAELTAIEAMRINAQTTAEYEQRIQEQLRITAQADVMYFQIQSWTATIALTSIPLTATQQTHNNTQIANSQRIIAGQLTGTHEAPTRMAAIAAIDERAKFAQIDRVFRIGFLFVITIFVLSISVYLWRQSPSVTTEIAEESEETEKRNHIDITLRDEKNPWHSGHFVLPCSEEQLTELSELVVNGDRTFGYNRMETTSRTFRGQRDVLVMVRSVLEKANLATTNTHTGESVINDRGVDFFTQWFETHQLPDGFEIAEAV